MRIARLLIIFVASMAILCGATWAANAKNAYQQDLFLKMATGKEMKLSELAGKPSIIIFYSSVCGAKGNRDVMNRINLAYRDKGLQVLGVGMRDECDEFLKFAKKERYSFQSGFDSTRAVAKSFRAYSLPYTVFVAKDGRIAAKVMGVLTEEKVRAELAKIGM